MWFYCFSNNVSIESQNNRKKCQNTKQLVTLFLSHSIYMQTQMGIVNSSIRHRQSVVVIVVTKVAKLLHSHSTKLLHFFTSSLLHLLLCFPLHFILVSNYTFWYILFVHYCFEAANYLTTLRFLMINYVTVNLGHILRI